MGPVAVVVGVISAVAGVVGGIMQYRSQQSQASAARRQGEAQSAAAAENARRVQAAAQLEKYRHRRRLESLMGTQRANFGAAGVVEEGTPLDILEDTAYQSELDSMQQQYHADQQSQAFMAEAANYRSAGETLASSYESQAGTSLLTGIATGVGRGVGAYDSYQSWRYPRRSE